MTNRYRLPAGSSARLFAVTSRAVRRHCPYCGGPGIFESWWTLRPNCPHCGVSFEREEGYFLGAYAVNLLIAEFLGMGLVVAMLIWSGFSTLSMQIIAVVLAVGLPLLFFPYSRTLWMALDLVLDPPRDKPERQLRHHDIRP